MSTQNRQKSNDKKNIIDKADMNSPTNVQQHHFVFNTSSHYLKKNYNRIASFVILETHMLLECILYEV